MPQSPRDARLDVLRALSILVVLAAHTVADDPHCSDSLASACRVFIALARPVLPAFWWMSGYLYNPAHNDGKQLAKRIWRLAKPYLVCSALALLYPHRYEIYRREFGFLDLDFILGGLWKLLIGDAFGIYYFVFTTILGYCLLHLIFKSATLSSRLGTLVALAAGLHLAQNLLVEPALIAQGREVFTAKWMFRSPAHWASFVLFGAWCRQRRWDFASAYAKRVSALAYLGTLAALLPALTGLTTPLPGAEALTLVNKFAFIPFVLAFAPRKPLWATLAAASYTIYLVHPFFIYFFRYDVEGVLRVRLGIVLGSEKMLLIYAFALFGSLAVHTLIERLKRTGKTAPPRPRTERPASA